MSSSSPRERGRGVDIARSNPRRSRRHVISYDLGDDDMEVEDGDDSGEYHDAAEHSRADDEGGEIRAGRSTAAPTTRFQLLRLLGQVQTVAQQLHRPLLARRHRDSDEDAEDEEIEGGYGGIRKRRRARDKYPAVPSDVGRALMDSGTFGDKELCEGGHERKDIRMASRIFERELGFNTGVKEQTQNRLMAQSMIPPSAVDTIIHYDRRCYSGQFSDDGSLFFSCCQDFKVRLYDTSNPHRWKYYRTVDCPYGYWTITDASLSPDNKFLAYSSIHSVVCLAPTDPDVVGGPWSLDFSTNGSGGAGISYFGARADFGIWSIRFSGDGREIVAGTSGESIYVYDLETRQPTLRVRGHSDDVNAVCFADKSSSHILFSGSDDTTLKVWDRRSMGDSRAAGVFLGHTEGLTYVDSKGDGRYVLSNGKDQTMKLWDIRKMVSTERFSRIDPARYSTHFDYRHAPFEEDDYKPHPHDCSLVTFRGHKVLKTLIRCHFSPPTSSNSRYVYTGSSDGKVYIYNLDATLAGVINVRKGTLNSRPRDPNLSTGFHGFHLGSTGAWKTCVRDASWHPSAPIIAASSWNGWGMATGTCTTHIWNDGFEEAEAGPKRVNERLEYEERLNTVGGGVY